MAPFGHYGFQYRPGQGECIAQGMRSRIMWKSSAPVVVGVDGSDAAINAAK